jgi:hypothetical protein
MVSALIRTSSPRPGRRGRKRPVDLNLDEMAKYRDQMKAHYLKVQIQFR